MSSEASPAWLSVLRAQAPLILTMPHTGVEIPDDLARGLSSAWLARKDADWWVERLYDFAHELGATVVRTSLSRTVIDANRDPSGASLYPGQPTTELCPTTTFDGEPLYVRGQAPDCGQIAERSARYFHPYHRAIEEEIARLRARHANVVVYDCHSIRSHIPRLFTGVLPHFNIGTNHGATCAPALTRAVQQVCAATAFSHVVNGRFRGGYTTRHYGRPAAGVHAIQMELACRGYLAEPDAVHEGNWPVAYAAEAAAPMRTALRSILEACIEFAERA